MLSIKYDTMLIVVYIWRILKSPFSVIDRKRYDPVILSCRVIHSSCISFIFHAKLTPVSYTHLDVYKRQTGLSLCRLLARTLGFIGYRLIGVLGLGSDVRGCLGDLIGGILGRVLFCTLGLG